MGLVRSVIWEVCGGRAFRKRHGIDLAGVIVDSRRAITGTMETASGIDCPRVRRTDQSLTGKQTGYDDDSVSRQNDYQHDHK